MSTKAEDQAELDAINAELVRRGEKPYTPPSQMAELSVIPPGTSPPAPPPDAPKLPSADQAELDAINAELVRRGENPYTPPAPQTTLSAQVDLGAPVPSSQPDLERSIASTFERPKEVTTGFGLTNDILGGLIDRAVPPGSKLKTELEKYPDWMRAPELREDILMIPRTVFGTMITDIDETEKILKSRYPGMKIEKKDNYLVIDSKDGGKYTWKPGFRWSDAARVGMTIPFLAGAASGTVAAFGAGLASELGGAALGAAALEGLKNQAGGDVSWGNILAAPFIHGAVKGVGAVARGVGNTVRGYLPEKLGGIPSMPQVPGAAPEAPAPAAAAATPPAAAMPPEVTVAEREAGLAGKKAELATEYERLAKDKGYIAPNSPAGRAVAQAQKGLIEAEAAAMTSPELKPKTAAAVATAESRLAETQAGAAEKKALADVAATKAEAAAGAAEVALKTPANEMTRRLETEAQQRMAEMTAGAEPGRVNPAARKHIGLVIDRLKTGSRAILSSIDKKINSKPADTQIVLDKIKELASGLTDGIEGLPKFVQDMYRDLSPIVKKIKKEVVEIPRTWKDLDSVTKATGKMMRGNNILADSETNRSFAKALYEPLREAQAATAKNYGLEQEFLDGINMSRAYHEARKKAITLFGKQAGKVLEGDIVPRASQALLSAGKDAPSKLAKFLDSMTPDMRSDVMTAAMSSTFGEGQTLNMGKFGPWMRRVMGNAESKAAVESALGAERWQGAKDMYQVFRKLETEAAKETEYAALRSAAEKTAKEAETLGGASDRAQRGLKRAEIRSNAAKETADLELQSKEDAAVKRVADRQAALENKRAGAKETLKRSKEAAEDAAFVKSEKARKARAAAETPAKVAKEAKVKEGRPLRKRLGDVADVAGGVAAYTGNYPAAAGAFAAGRVLKSKALGEVMNMVPFRRVMSSLHIPETEWAPWLEQAASSMVIGRPEDK